MKQYIFILGFLFIAQVGLFAQCEPPTSQAELNINNIRAKVYGAGHLWSEYFYPGEDYILIDNADDSLSLLNNAAIWLTAKDVYDDYRVAAQISRSQGDDMFSGPIINGTATTASCDLYDKHWTVLQSTIDNHISEINSNNLPLDANTIDLSILEWPAKGNQHLLDYGFEIVDDLAPFIDANDNGTYEPEYGDYPKIKGDQSIFWVMNDIGNNHTQSDMPFLGVEIQCMAFAYAQGNELDNTTFYEYTVINKSNNNLHDFYFSFFVYPNAAEAGQIDNYIRSGCDTSRNMSYYYNDSITEMMTGVAFLNTPDCKPMSSYVYSYHSDPTDIDFENFFIEQNLSQGLWWDGNPITYGAGGFGDTLPTKFLYSGNPANCDEWSQCNLYHDCTNYSLPEGERMPVMNVGPYLFDKNEELLFRVAVFSNKETSFSSCPDVATTIGAMADEIKSLVNDDFHIATCGVEPLDTTSFLELRNSDFITVYPNPSTGKIVLEGIDVTTISSLAVYNIEGKALFSKENLSSNELNLSHLDAGIYYLQRNDKNGKQYRSKKLVLMD